MVPPQLNSLGVINPGLTLVPVCTSMYQYVPVCTSTVCTSTICWENSIVALGSPFFSVIFRTVDARSFSASPLDGPLEQTQGTTVSVTCEPAKHICDIRLMLLGQGIASIAGEFRVQLEAPMGFTLAHAWLIFSRSKGAVCDGRWRQCRIWRKPKRLPIGATLKRHFMVF